jgi:hypothetical protein
MNTLIERLKEYRKTQAHIAHRVAHLDRGWGNPNRAEIEALRAKHAQIKSDKIDPILQEINNWIREEIQPLRHNKKACEAFLSRGGVQDCEPLHFGLTDTIRGLINTYAYDISVGDLAFRINANRLNPLSDELKTGELLSMLSLFSERELAILQLEYSLEEIRAMEYLEGQGEINRISKDWEIGWKQTPEIRELAKA